MKLYSVSDVLAVVREAFHPTGFSIVMARNGVMEIEQVQGIVSQRFLIKVESTPREPV
jgi:hypothetical protein